MSSQYLNDDLSALDYVQKDYLRGLQLERLRKMVQHAYDHVELFNSRMKERNLVPADVKSLGDIAKLPFMVKADLRDTYPFGLFAVPMSEVVRLHASSGTTGKPIVVGYTRSDLEVWMEVVKRAFASCGLTRDDVIQVSYGYGLFTGGLGAHYGAEALGATVVPTSGGNTQRQIMLMRDFGTTAVCCTPSYFNFMIEQALAQGIDMRDLPIKAQTDRSRFRDQGLRYLRPLRNHRPWRRDRVRLPAGDARVRGSLLSRDHQSGNRRSAAGRRNRRAGADHAFQIRDADDPLPDA